MTVSCEEGMHITDDGVHMFYRLANPEGAGFPLVMVQGLSGVADDWRGFDAALAAAGPRPRPVLSFDHRGLGRSGGTAPSSTRNMANDVLGLVAKVLAPTRIHRAPPVLPQARRVHVLGASMGGMITQTLCAMVREGAAVGGGGRGPAPAITVLSAVLGCTMAGTLTDKLAVLGHLPVGVRAFAATPPVPLGPYPTVVETVRHAAAARVAAVMHPPQWGLRSPQEYRRVVEGMYDARRPPLSIAAQLAGVATFDASGPPHRLGAPSLVIHGTEDVVVPVECGHRLAAGLADSELLELPGAGHMFWDSDLEQSVQHIAGFLARNEPPSSPKDEAMPIQ